MKITNELLKEIIRYHKDKGEYPKLKETINNYITTNNTIKNEKEFLATTNNPLFIPYNIGMDNGDTYCTKFLLYYGKKHKEEIINLFEKFLKENKIKQTFYDNIDENFIEYSLSKYSNIGTKLFMKKNTKKDTLYDNIAPTALIMYAFRWSTAKTKKPVYWGTMNQNWLEYLRKYIKEKYNV